MGRQRFIKPYMWLIVGVGAAVFLFSAYRLPVAQLDLRFLFLALITIGIGLTLTIQIPHLSSYISVSDTLIFLAMLLYGGEAAILLAAVVAICETLRFSKKPMTILFNSAVTACSTFLTVWTLRLCLGPVGIVELPRSEYSAISSSPSASWRWRNTPSTRAWWQAGRRKTTSPSGTNGKGLTFVLHHIFCGASTAGIIAKW